MVDDPIAPLLKVQDMLHQNDLIKIAEAAGASVEAWRRAGERFSGLKIWDANSDFLKLASDLTRQSELMRVAMKPVDSQVLNRLSGFTQEVSAIERLLAAFRTQFTLPQSNELTNIVSQFQNSALALRSDHLGIDSSTLKRAMEAMQTPWLDTQDKLKSVAGFAELQSLGLAVRQLSSFGEGLTEQLRVSLGDWRGKVAWPTDIFDDANARTAFYVDKGFDARLTAFPTEAFSEGIAVAGLSDRPPPLLDQYVGETTKDQQPSLERTKAAYDRLLRFETQIRKFINEQMTRHFGPDWIKHQVPEPIRNGWQQKKAIARKRGEQDWPLIAYADFTDYVPLITRQDNWKVAFEPIFQRAESVIESFQRLYPIRLCTMHARLITADDELYMFVELKRLLTAIDLVA